jgi:hypothetical protein
MSLDASRISAAIATALQAAPVNAHAGAALTQFCDAIATAVVNEITGHAVVAPTLLVAPPGGGPVTGTGTVT